MRYFDHDQCVADGFAPDTQQYAACVASLAHQRQELGVGKTGDGGIPQPAAPSTQYGFSLQ